MSGSAIGSGAIAPVNLRQPWQRALGPFLALTEVAQLLSIDDTRLAELSTAGRLLVVEDVNGERVIPAFTLAIREGCAIHGRAADDFQLVLRTLTRTTDEPWLCALWLSGMLAKHDGWCAMDLLLAHQTDLVLARARNEDWTWLAN